MVSMVDSRQTRIDSGWQLFLVTLFVFPNLKACRAATGPLQGDLCHLSKKFTPGSAVPNAVDDYEHESISVPVQRARIILELFEKLDESNWFYELGEA